MRLQIGVVDKDIIKKHSGKLPKKREKGVIHSSLEYRWCIIETKWHDLEFIVVMVGSEGCLMDIRIRHTYLVKALSKV